MHPCHSTRQPILSDDLPPISSTGGAESSPATHAAAGARAEQIGPYKILGLLGSGGMGVVYLAEQEQTRRQVALKMMKPGTATPERLRRFEFEAQALGRLEHPGIARIYQAGTADAGQGPQPYFAMELIRGQPLNAYTEQKQFGVKERLRLMIQVCQAMQYAHHHGVIHRDLKPGNILVDAAGQPRVLDFGVARVTDGDLAASSLQTDEGQLVGTLPYMSPEQAAADPRAIDWRSDVYTLGVICYELVSGRLPRELKGKGVIAAVRTLTEQEPARLSSVSKRFCGDLDTIVAKALDRDKEQRYQSAADLAADLECYLDDRPIKARPAGAVYHILKFARRHKAAAAVVLAVVLVLVGATVISTRYALSAGRAERTARDALAETSEKAARLAMQRGAWREAIDMIDNALATDRYRGSVPLRLNKVRALLALNERERYVREIEALAGTANLGKNEGSVLLLQGDILVGSDDVRAEQLIRLAQQKGLPDGEKPYADALLAKTTRDAVDHLRQAVELDRYQPRAHACLGLLLMTLGELAEARYRLSVYEAIFPEDVNVMKLRAFLAGLNRDVPGADRVLDKLNGQLATDQLTAFRALVRFLSAIRDPANKPDPVTGLPNVLQHLGHLAPVLPGLWQVQAGAGPNDVSAALKNLFLDGSLPLRVRQGLFGLLVWARADMNEAGMVDAPLRLGELKQAIDVHSEGTLLYLWASLLLVAQKYDEVEPAALKAAETSSLFPIRRQALLCAALAQGMRHLRKPDPVLRSQIVQNLRKMLAAEPSHVLFRPKEAVSLALHVEEFGLMRVLLDDWRRQDPDNPGIEQYWAILRQREKPTQLPKPKEVQEKKAPAKQMP
jgi:hypothetical protein